MAFQRSLPLALVTLAMLAGDPLWEGGGDSLQARGSSPDGYLRAVALHFEVPLEEVQVLADWGLPMEEVPVVLLMAERSGVASDAIIALRRGGASWMSLAQRYGLDAGTFHISLTADEAGDLLGAVRDRFQSAPPGQWAGIQLSDSEVVALVNVRILSRELGVSAGRVVEARTASDDFVQAYGTLLPGG